MTKFISWYADPRYPDRRQWLCFNEGEGVGSGYWYSSNWRDAYQFDTRAEALAVTPTYDGSSGIERRTGVAVALEDQQANVIAFGCLCCVIAVVIAIISFLLFRH